jgi:hypothetical protein
VWFIFSPCQRKKILTAQYFLQRLSNPITQNEMEEIMKKTNSMLSFANTEVNINVDFTANVNLGKRGGGGSNM